MFNNLGFEYQKHSMQDLALKWLITNLLEKLMSDNENQNTIANINKVINHDLSRVIQSLEVPTTNNQDKTKIEVTSIMPYNHYYIGVKDVSTKTIKKYEILFFLESGERYKATVKGDKYVVKKESMSRFPNNYNKIRTHGRVKLQESKGVLGLKGYFVDVRDYVELLTVEEARKYLPDIVMDSNIKYNNIYLTYEDLVLNLERQGLNVDFNSAISIENKGGNPFVSYISSYYKTFLGIDVTKYILKYHNETGGNYVLAFTRFGNFEELLIR